jgi:hypothetical protein
MAPHLAPTSERAAIVDLPDKSANHQRIAPTTGITLSDEGSRREREQCRRSVLKQSLRYDPFDAHRTAFSVALASFWRMCGGLQQSGTVPPGHDRYRSGLRDRLQRKIRPDAALLRPPWCNVLASPRSVSSGHSSMRARRSMEGPDGRCSSRWIACPPSCRQFSSPVPLRSGRYRLPRRRPAAEGRATRPEQSPWLFSAAGPRSFPQRSFALHGFRELAWSSRT